MSRKLLDKRFALSLSSWFIVPEFGMRDLEILSRASAFVVKGRSSMFPHKYHVVTSSHVVAPWRWPKYYQMDWLENVTEANMQYSAELRHTDASFLNHVTLSPISYHHPTRDVAVLHIDGGEEAAMDFMRSLDFDSCELSDVDAGDGDKLYFEGHDVTGAIAEDGTDLRKPYPKTVQGTFKGRGPVQLFASTDGYVVDGMCGGPVVMDSGRGAKTICGMLEGIVATDHPITELRGLAAFIGSNELALFLAKIEAGAEDVLRLEGGEALRAIAEQEDPANLTLEGIEQRAKDKEKERGGKGPSRGRDAGDVYR